MPAVFTYYNQLEKAVEVGNGNSGYIGLRRGKSNIITPSPNFSGLFTGAPWYETGVEFSEPFKNINFGYITGTGQVRSVPESYYIFNNYLNTGWSWIDSIGTAAYRVAGSGYEKIRTFTAGFSAEFNENVVSSIYNITGYIEPLRFTQESISFTNEESAFSFVPAPDYYKSGSGLDGQLGLIHSKIYTGTVVGDLEMTENTLAGTGNSTSQYLIPYTLPEGSENPVKIRYLLFDEVGSGVPSSTLATNFGKKSQASVVSLDPEYYTESNFKTVSIPFEYTTAPQVSFNIYYTGDYSQCPTITFIGALLSGFSNNKLTFIFSDVIPGTGYALSWQTNSLA